MDRAWDSSGPVRVERAGFGSEIKIPVEWVSAGLAAFGLILFIVSDDPELTVDRGILQRYVLVLLAASLSSLILARWRPAIGSWFLVAAIAGLVYIGAAWHGSLAYVTLVPVPVLVAGLVIGPAAAVVATVCQVASVALLTSRAGSGDAFALLAPVAALAGTLALVLAANGSMSRLADWVEEYAQMARAAVDEVRARRGELEETLSRLERANRQLALSSQRMSSLRASAEEAQRSKSVFVANVSHEFRTPLNTIMGLVELMVERTGIYAVALPPKMRDDLRTIHRNCRHLAAMIGDVLDLTQMEEGRLTLHRERADLARLIETSVDAVRPLAERKDLPIRVHVQRDLPLVYCDRTRIRQVIVNLLSNAVRHTDDGSIEVVAALEGEGVRVSVADTGSGIAAEDVERVFEPFYQGGTAIWRDRGGSGLGLSVSREFIRRHGGRIWLESELGRGTTVHVKLPTSGLVGPVGPPGHQIRPDWPWREPAFMTRGEESLDELVKPRIVVHDSVGSLAPELSRYEKDAEFVAVEDVTAVVRELNRCPANGVLLNAESADSLWSSVDRLGDAAPGTPILGCSFKWPVSRAGLIGAQGHLVKPVSRADLASLFEGRARPIENVLIVDDDPTTVDMFARMLHGIDDSLVIRTASSGAAALHSVDEQVVDLVLLDLVMDDVDGRDVALRMRGDTRFEDTMIVLVSAHDPNPDPPSSEFLLGATGRGIPLDSLIGCALRLAGLLTKA